MDRGINNIHIACTRLGTKMGRDEWLRVLFFLHKYIICIQLTSKEGKCADKTEDESEYENTLQKFITTQVAVVYFEADDQLEPGKERSTSKDHDGTKEMDGFHLVILVLKEECATCIVERIKIIA